MEFALWSLLIGGLLVLVAITGSVLQRLPLSTSMLYLVMGLAVSPPGLDLLQATVFTWPVLLERLSEVAVLISLFTAGLKLSPGLSDRRWRLPLRLALVSMVVTVLAIAAVAHLALGLAPGESILLGGILAPTDPVLASDVQLHEAGDRDRLRFALTGEGGLNDGTAFPFVMLGLGLMGLHEIGDCGWHWLAVDVLWATACGIGTGALLGVAIGRLVLYLRQRHQEAVGLDDFLAMGLIGLSYGAAQFLHGYGFLAVFAAGVALRRIERRRAVRPRRSLEAVSQAALNADRSAVDAVAVDPEHAPSYLAQAVLGFNEQIERLGEVVVVIAIGALLWSVNWNLASPWLVGLLLFAIRPLSVWIGLAGSASSRTQRRLISWFGIRGIGSLYYLMYAIHHGLPRESAERLVAMTLSTVVTSIVLHGLSVTPLMALYERHLRSVRR